MELRLAEENECTGCTACFSICKHGAITMVEEDNGFCYPRINADSCISCGACSSVCPVFKDHDIVIKTSKAYALWDKDNCKRLEGSSGGLFGRLAEYIINNNGVVFGAAFKNGVLDLECQCSEDVDLSLMKKSKYVESKMNDSINRIEGYLKQGRLVLFCGTPCEVMGIRARFKYQYPNLLLVDFLCHGVPSQKAYHKYINDTERHYNSKVENISFRSKCLGWKTYCMYIKFANGKEYIKPGIIDPFFRMYFRNLSYRPSCYKCNRITCSESDITIGDYWGVLNNRLIKDTDEGISLIIIHNIIGEQYLNRICSDFNIFDLDFEDYKYVYNYRNIEPKALIDFDKFDYYHNDLISKPSLISRIKAVLFSFKLSRYFIYKK